MLENLSYSYYNRKASWKQMWAQRGTSSLVMDQLLELCKVQPFNCDVDIADSLKDSWEE